MILNKEDGLSHENLPTYLVLNGSKNQWLSYTSHIWINPVSLLIPIISGDGRDQEVIGQTCVRNHVLRKDTEWRSKVLKHTVSFWVGTQIRVLNEGLSIDPYKVTGEWGRGPGRIRVDGKRLEEIITINIRPLTWFPKDILYNRKKQKLRVSRLSVNNTNVRGYGRGEWGLESPIWLNVWPNLSSSPGRQTQIRSFEKRKLLKVTYTILLFGETSVCVCKTSKG